MAALKRGLIDVGVTDKWSSPEFPEFSSPRTDNQRQRFPFVEAASGVQDARCRNVGSLPGRVGQIRPNASYSKSVV